MKELHITVELINCTNDNNMYIALEVEQDLIPNHVYSPKSENEKNEQMNYNILDT